MAGIQHIPIAATMKAELTLHEVIAAFSRNAEFHQSSPQNLDIDHVIGRVAGFYRRFYHHSNTGNSKLNKLDITLEAIKSPNRQPHISEARQVSMYLARKYSQKSIAHIARVFGGRDGYSITFACKKIEDRMTKTYGFNSWVKAIEGAITDSLVEDIDDDSIMDFFSKKHQNFTALLKQNFRIDVARVPISDVTPDANFNTIVSIVDTLPGFVSKEDKQAVLSYLCVLLLGKDIEFTRNKDLYRHVKNEMGIKKLHLQHSFKQAVDAVNKGPSSPLFKHIMKCHCKLLTLEA